MRNLSGFRGLLLAALVGIFTCCAPLSAMSENVRPGADSHPQDTTVYYLRGLDTLLIEIHPDTLQIYRQSPAWSIRNNIFYDLSGTPNIGFEIPITGHSSLGANLGFKHWDRFFPWQKPSDYSEGGPAAGTLHGYTSDSKWRNLVIAPEYRFYIDTINTGLFLGADLLYTHYNTGAVKFPLGMYKSVREQRVQGDFFGLGLFAGYSWWLSDHWRLELEAGAALGYRNHRIFECAHCGREIGRAKGPAVAPKLGLNLAYTFGQPKPGPVDSVVYIPAIDTVRAIPYIPTVPLVEEWKGEAGRLEKDNPILRPSSEYRPYTPDVVLRKEGGPLYVHFELDKSVIKRDFRGNGEVLDRIIDITEKILADTTSSVTCIQIVGLASIEGSERHNKQLSANRANALQKYIQDRLTAGDSLFERVSGGEAWTEFRDQVNDLKIEGSDNLTGAEIEKVLDIIDNEPDPARRERRLRTLDGGRVYNILRNELLSDQRNSGYIRIYYDYVPDENALTINRAIALTREGRHAEALALLEGVKGDPRSWLAYSTSLYYNNRPDEAVAVLERLASAKLPDGSPRPEVELARENLQQMLRVIEHNKDVGKPIYPDRINR